MTANDDFWDFYWETRLLPLENLGKQAAILSASRLIRQLSPQVPHPLRLLELGCGGGVVIGSLLAAHFQLCDAQNSLGIDYNPQSLAQCQGTYPGLRTIAGDFTNPAVLAELGKFEIVLLVNALHEVFSDCYAPALGEIDLLLGKQRVAQALGAAAGCLAPGGRLILLDGLEPPGDPQRIVRIRFRDRSARQEFDIFAAQYHPFRITCQETGDPLSVELSQRDFTRYITKSIFLGKGLWETERWQSYQYFSEAEFRAAFAELGLQIFELNTLTMNAAKWRYRVELERTPYEFPDEHILIVASR